MTKPGPAEWTEHRAMWVGFPSHADLWQEDLATAQAEVAALVRALATAGGERVRLLVHGPEAMMSAHDLLSDLTAVEFVDGRFGDIWLRDTGPIVVGDRPAAFRFKAVGGTHLLPRD